MLFREKILKRVRKNREKANDKRRMRKMKQKSQLLGKKQNTGKKGAYGVKMTKSWEGKNINSIVGILGRL